MPLQLLLKALIGFTVQMLFTGYSSLESQEIRLWRRGTSGKGLQDSVRRSAAATGIGKRLGKSILARAMAIGGQKFTRSSRFLYHTQPASTHITAFLSATVLIKVCVP